MLVDGFGIIPYNNIIIHKEVTKMTNAQLVLQKIQDTLCHEGTTYKGNSGTYMFIEGKTTAEGTINGVVKKIDEQGVAKTAGSFKIVEDVEYTVDMPAEMLYGFAVRTFVGSL